MLSPLSAQTAAYETGSVDPPAVSVRISEDLICLAPGLVSPRLQDLATVLCPGVQHPYGSIAINRQIEHRGPRKHRCPGAVPPAGKARIVHSHQEPLRRHPRQELVCRSRASCRSTASDRPELATGGAVKGAAALQIAHVKIDLELEHAPHWPPRCPSLATRRGRLPFPGGALCLTFEPLHLGIRANYRSVLRLPSSRPRKPKVGRGYRW